jgi:hypothetical protein
MQESSQKPSSESLMPVSFASLLSLIFIDLLKLLRKGVYFLYRNKIVLGLATIAGIVVGVLFYRVTPLSYKLTMIVKPTEMNGKIFGQMLSSLDNLARSSSYDELAKNFNISREMAPKIASISGQTLQGIDLIKDTSQNYDKPFIIELVVKDNNISEVMQSAILTYFNNNRYLNKLKNDKALLYTDKIAFLDSELMKVDSLKTSFNNFLALSKTPSMYYNNAMDPVSAYTTSSSLYNERNAIKEWLQQNREVLVQVDGFKPSKVPNSKGPITFVLLYGVVFFLLGCLIILLVQVIKQESKG